jgi:flagellar hook-associated protein 2
MPTITSTGQSGLNVNALVSQLVAAERAPLDAKIIRAEAKATTEFTAIAQLKGAMSSLQGALAGLKKPDDFLVRKTTISAEGFFTASATAKAAAGSYEIEVRQLAKAAQLGSAAVVGGATATVGTGTLTIAMGSSSIAVTLATGANTLADLRDAINAAPGNPGINAALVTDISGAHLVLSGTKTGVANDLRVTASGGDGGLARFTYDLPATTTMTPLVPAQDAIVFVSGYEIHDSDNTVEDAIEGVALKLAKSETGTTTTLNVALDSSGIRDKAAKFVSSYNVLASQISKLQSYDAEKKLAGPLLGDSMLRGFESQLRRIVSDDVTGITRPIFTTLASVGITSNVDGTLRLDSTKFDAAIARDSTAASNLFASENGLSVKLSKLLTDKLADGAELAVRDTRMASRRKDIEKQKEKLELRIEQIDARYKKQFNSLDSLLTQLQSTSSYLAQQLAAL